MSLTCTMIRGDCLEVMPTLPKKSVGMCFADLPYAITSCEWDIGVSLLDFWLALCGLIMPNTPIVMSAVQPFTTRLVMSRFDFFRHELSWVRHQARGFFNAKRSPLRRHESILVFAEKTPTYAPIMTPARDARSYGAKRQSKSIYGVSKEYSERVVKENYPTSVCYFDESDLRHDTLAGHVPKRIHPTQKPVALLEWLIRTYSNPGDHVLDPVSGSATTAVAGLACGRSVTCIEKDPTYFEAGVERVRKHIADNQIDAKVETRR